MAVEPPYRIKNMVPGMIMLWYGSIATIPSGWHLCDGTMGTPNLSSKFVIGAFFALAPGLTGGSTSHTHTFDGDGHAHSIEPGTDIAAGADFDELVEENDVHGTTNLGTNLPPWHALCYIMKL